MEIYNVKVLLVSGKEIDFDEVEAKSYDEAINKIIKLNLGNKNSHFEKEDTYYRIDNNKIVGYEVNRIPSEEESKNRLLGK